MISTVYRRVLRPLFFSLDAEKAHQLAMQRLSAIAGNRALLGLLSLACKAPRMERSLFGLTFPNPIGLAAGFDKNAEALPAWAALGFGFIEVGTVTAHPQPGNDQPRLFRLPRHGALFNRMGFNNEGAEAVAARLARWRQRKLWPKVPVGINIGKSKVTALEDAPADYAFSFSKLKEHGDYFVVNVSSPNTPGLRTLQEAGAMERLLLAISDENEKGGDRKPLLVKLAPDLDFADLNDLIDVAERRGVDGFVISNTSIDPTLLPEGEMPTGGGGLSGRPLRERATALISYVSRQSALPIIGVGGVEDAESAVEKFTAGAALIQIYTAFVYEGPQTVQRLVRDLSQRAATAGE